jgi:hypothetical protein
MNSLRRLLLLAAVSVSTVFATAMADEKPTTKAEEKATTKSVPAVRVAPAVKSAPVKEKAPEKKELSSEEKAKATPTHEKASEISIASKDGKLKLQTLTADKNGNVLGLVGAPRYFDPSEKNSPVAEVHVYDADGKKVRDFSVGFNGQSLNTAPDGTIFVAGDGKLGKFSADGKSLGTVALPHIEELLKDKAKMKADAEAQLKQQQESFERSVKQFKERVEKLEAKKAEELTKAEKSQLEQYKQILESYKETEKYYKSMSVDSIISQTVGRLRTINSVAVTPKDVFIVCGESKGYGYAIWRMTHDFKDPKQVMGSVGGCCGQMDLQVGGDDFLLAENTKYQFARYDRDGKKVGSWGKGQMAAVGQESPPDCFGGCCNPMNLRVGAKGNVYTAESEGVIKSYSPKGEFLSTVARAPLSGGCKNVAVAVTPDEKTVFFCDQPGSKIIVLKKKKETASTSAGSGN